MRSFSSTFRTLNAVTLAFAFASLSVGCAHYTAEIPGVLDLRSDGRGAPVRGKVSVGARSGPGGILSGSGVTRQGGMVHVEDRHQSVLLLWLFTGKSPFFNESSTPEMQQALNDQALRHVVVGHGITPFDLGISWLGDFAVGWIIPYVSGILLGPSSWTFTASGQAIATSAEAGSQEALQ